MQKTEKSKIILSMVTHEIRNPVTLINSYLQLLSSAHPEVRDFPYWDSIQEEMAHLRALLDQISSCRNEQRLRKISLNITEYLQKYIHTAAPLWSQASHVTFHFSSEKHLPRVPADPDKLRQVLDNLLRNAFEAAAQAADSPDSMSAKEGAPFYVRLHAGLQDGFVCISVEDNGCGIPEEYLGTLFDPFVTHKPQGTGLGLAICAQVAKAHGGTLTCASAKDPTEFRLLLPAEIRR